MLIKKKKKGLDNSFDDKKNISQGQIAWSLE